ncbi:MAG: ankyrin repeat domain-containing protein, partial [Nitrospirae bacterium]|nr:ankyrin repeat domain-containing protein [Nitrospirota bacterium]
MTRAVEGVTLIEEDPSHPFLALLGLKTAGEEVRLAAQRSDAEEWSREARRLELQGRLEQAAAIRNTMLGHRPVPWEVMDLARLEHIVRSALDPKGVSSKARRQLYEYAMLLDEPWYRESLARMGFCAERPAPGERAALTRKHLDQFETKNLKPALAAVETHGIEYRTPHNLTPLMVAACVGNVAMVEALCERGADPGAADAFGRTALHLALSRAMGDPAFAGGPLARLWEALAPPSLPLMADSRLRKLDRAGGEYLLVQIMLSAMRARVEGAKGLYANIGFATADFAALAAFPENAVPDYRKRRAYLSGLLAKNEIGRVDLYNKKLFLRIAHGPRKVRRRSNGGADGVGIRPERISGLSASSKKPFESTQTTIKPLSRRRRGWMIQKLRGGKQRPKGLESRPPGTAPLPSRAKVELIRVGKNRTTEEDRRRGWM